MSPPVVEAEAALFCRVRGSLCAFPLQHVVETMRPQPVTPLAGVPPFVRGLAVVRGAPVAVLDAGAVLDAEASRDGAADAGQGRFVTVRAGGRVVAVAVEAVLGVRRLPGALADLPPLLRPAGAEAVTAVGLLDAELLLVLRAARLVPEAAWSVIDGAGAAP